jgi:putative membrane protein
VTKEITMMYYGTGMSGWGMVLMSLSGLLLWGLIIAGIVVAVRYTGGAGLRGEPVVHGPTPQQLLADRFARGDIDEEQYTRNLSVLDATAPTRGPGAG